MTPEKVIPAGARDTILASQRGEITEHDIYRALAAEGIGVREPEGPRGDCRRGARFITGSGRPSPASTSPRTGSGSPSTCSCTGYSGSPSPSSSWSVARRRPRRSTGTLLPDVPGLGNVLLDEERHEQALIALIDEERLRYTGSIVLGLNDALVELTGTLAGLTLAFQNTRVIAMAGLITGIAAALSMGSAEYLSTKSEGDGRNPVQAATYTLVAYIITVIFLVAPVPGLRELLPRPRRHHPECHHRHRRLHLLHLGDPGPGLPGAFPRDGGHQHGRRGPLVPHGAPRAGPPPRGCIEWGAKGAQGCPRAAPGGIF